MRTPVRMSSGSRLQAPAQRRAAAASVPGAGVWYTSWAAGWAGVWGNIKSLKSLGWAQISQAYQQQQQAVLNRPFVLLFSLSALVALNIFFFLLGGSLGGGGMKGQLYEQEEAGFDDPQYYYWSNMLTPPPAWSSQLQEPPRGLTCEAWLSQGDVLSSAYLPASAEVAAASSSAAAAAEGEEGAAGQSSAPTLSRNFLEDPVLVASPARPQDIRPCAVGCRLVPLDAPACDAQVRLAGDNAATEDGGSGDSRGRCKYLALRLPHPRHMAKKQLTEQNSHNSSNVLYMGASLNSHVPIGIPSWGDHALLRPVTRKTAAAPILAILNEDCAGMQTRLDLVREFRRQGVGVDLYGSCVGNVSSRPQHSVEPLCQHLFVLLFEDYASQDLVSQEFWWSLGCGTVPIVVARSSIAHLVPADNAFIQVSRAGERGKVVQWVKYLLKSRDMYDAMVHWKDDPLSISHKFLALLDLGAVPTECRLCLQVATQQLAAEEMRSNRPCRCWEDSANTTVYHIFVRERGTFHFLPFFLRSGELTIASLVKKVYQVFQARNHQVIWKGSRPPVLVGKDLPRAFRIYPVSASQRRALEGTAAFHNDKQIQAFIEAYPCPKLEIIFL